jgi:predicted nuclease of restriction endonuclease-like (RecB) superfamily
MPKKKQTNKTVASAPADDLAGLIQNLTHVHEHLKFQAAKAVNVNLTLRNWIFGWRIKEYELKGRDRAKYGERLFPLIAEKLTRLGVSNCERRQLYRYCEFYDAFPEIVGTLSPQLQAILVGKSGKEAIFRTLSRKSDFPPEKLLSNLSYSHLEELSEVEAGPKRNFYIGECIRGSWGVRELQRQVSSHYYERTLLSKDKAKLSRLTQGKAETLTAEEIIRNPYVFEFAGYKPREVMTESDIEDALLTKLQDFLLELGRGFCFEARQKRILIGGEHFFVDLVFYHRILKCHVLIELKTDSFKHEHLGQLNTYVNWYKKNEVASGDSPPIGLLLCTKKNHALVEYARAAIDNQLFISKYQLELPRKEEIAAFINEAARER